MFYCQETILNTTSMICQFMPTSYSTKCLEYIHEFGPVIVTLLKTGDPKELCAMAKMCSAGEQQKLTLIDTNPVDLGTECFKLVLI